MIKIIFFPSKLSMAESVNGENALNCSILSYCYIVITHVKICIFSKNFKTTHNYSLAILFSQFYLYTIY